jgi:hypothetical protein
MHFSFSIAARLLVVDWWTVVATSVVVGAEEI